MWCGLLLVGFSATGAQAFRPGPLRWGGRLGKKLFLTPTVPLDEIAAPQQLTLKESSDFKVPYFTANQDHTISCDDNDVRWCLEASGAERGHVVRVNHCTSRPAQKWRWLPWGPIQLEGTDQCIFVDENDGLTTASVQLGECVNTATDTWIFEDSAPVLAWSSSHKFLFAAFSIGAAVMVSTLGLGAWIWRKQRESGIVLASKGSVPLTMGQGGVCLTMRSNEIAMQQSNDAVPSPTVFYSGYTRGNDDGSPVDETAIDNLLEDRAVARRAGRFGDADKIKDDLLNMGIYVSDKDRKWTVQTKINEWGHDYRRAEGDKASLDESTIQSLNNLLKERQEARDAKNYKRADQILSELFHNHSVVVVDREYTWRFVGDCGHDYERYYNDGKALEAPDLQGIDKLLATRLSKQMNKQFAEADTLTTELYKRFGVSVDDRHRTWWCGSEYERDWQDCSVFEASDLIAIEELLATRMSKRRLKQFKEADALQKELKERFGIAVDDKRHTWWCSESKPLDL